MALCVMPQHHWYVYHRLKGTFLLYHSKSIGSRERAVLNHLSAVKSKRSTMFRKIHICKKKMYGGTHKNKVKARVITQF